MPILGRRPLLHSTAATALGLSSAAFTGGRAEASPPSPPSLADEVNDQVQREKAWAWGRGWFGAQDDCDANGYLSYFLQSSPTILQDATVNHNIGYSTIAATFPIFLNSASKTLGPGRVSKLFHVTGDVRYGLVAEHVYLKDVFTSTNGYTTQTIIDLDSERIVRNTDYWDSRKLCFVPGFDGAFLSGGWKEALWARFCMAAPQRQRRSVERYNIVKRA